jgi:hypothetical protein
MMMMMNSVALFWNLMSYLDNRRGGGGMFQLIVELKKVGNRKSHMMRNAVIGSVKVFILKGYGEIGVEFGGRYQCSGGSVSWNYKRDIYDKIVLQTMQGRLRM